MTNPSRQLPKGLKRISYTARLVDYVDMSMDTHNSMQQKKQPINSSGFEDSLFYHLFHHFPAPADI